MSHDKDFDRCDCDCSNKRCPFPFPFPFSRGDGCQPLATIGTTVLALPANTPIAITVNGLTLTGLFVGFDVASGTVVFSNGGTISRFSTSRICSIVAI